MKCCRYIEINNWKLISDQVYNLIAESSILEKKHSWNTIDPTLLLSKIPELEKAFEQWSLKIQTTAIIYRKPYYQGGVHIDNGKGVRALIPIKNFQGSYTKFFEVDNKECKVSYGKEGDKFYSIPPTAIIKEIASIETIKPYIFNPQVPHGVYTNLNCSHPRLTLTVGFNRSPIELLTQ